MSLKNSILAAQSKAQADALLKQALFHTPGISQNTRRKVITAHRSVLSRLPAEQPVIDSPAKVSKTKAAKSPAKRKTTPKAKAPAKKSTRKVAVAK